jgi:hypothetical protein
LFERNKKLIDPVKRKLSFDSDSESQLSENRQINNHSVLDHIFDDDYFEVSQQEFMNNNIDCNKKVSN